MRYIIRQGEPRPLAALLDHLARATHPQEVNVKDYKSKRSTEQNSYLWGVIYTQARDWIIEHEGVSLDPLIMHEHAKARFQPIVGSYLTEIEVDGRLKEVQVPVPKSTTQNNVEEMAEFLEKVAHYYVEHHNVQFRDDRYE